MTMIKRVFCIFIAVLLLCTLLAGCVAPQEEPSVEDPILTAIKEKWEQFVIDRTVKVTQAQLTFGLADSHIGLQTDEAVIDEILDICETLDLSSLRLTEDNAPPEISIYGDLHVVLSAAGTDIDSIFLYLKENGEVYLHCDIAGTIYWAYASGWYASDLLKEYKYSK